MRVVVVRHGACEDRDAEKIFLGANLDPSLADRGRRQAAAVARALKRHAIQPDIVFTGPQRRQGETVNTIARVLKAPAPIVAPALSEIAYGPWEGLSATDVLARWPEEAASWKKRGVWPAGVFGTSFESALAPVRAWWSQLPLESDATVLAVSSQGTLRLLYALAYPEGWKTACETGKATLANIRHGHWGEISASRAQAEVLRWNQPPGFLDRIAFFA